MYLNTLVKKAKLNYMND